MTIIEQLDAKVANKLLIPSHVLGITSFIRKLLFYLSSKQLDLQFLHAVAGRIDEILRPDSGKAVVSKLSDLFECYST
jgi:nucleolar pre-ribosomal-associated protein 1